MGKLARALSATATILLVVGVTVVPISSPCENHYLALRVPRNASSSEIRKAFHRESILFHPDKQRGLSVRQQLAQAWALLRRGLLRANDAFIASSRAYEILTSEDARRGHDAALGACEAALAAETAARRRARQGFLNGAPERFSLRGLCALAAETADAFAARAPPRFAPPLRLLARWVDGVATYLQTRGALQAFGAAFFCLMVAAALLPMLLTSVARAAWWPVKRVLRAAGLAEREERLRAEGMRLARERLAAAHGTAHGAAGSSGANGSASGRPGSGSAFGTGSGVRQRKFPVPPSRRPAPGSKPFNYIPGSDEHGPRF